MRRLVAVLDHIAPTLAARVRCCDDVSTLAADVRQIVGAVLAHEAGAHGIGRDGRPNSYGEELNALVTALGLRIEASPSRVTARSPRSR